jgi:hypothetical protein
MRRVLNFMTFPPTACLRERAGPRILAIGAWPRQFLAGMACASALMLRAETIAQRLPKGIGSRA